MRLIGSVLALAMVALGAFALWPRQEHFRTFDPVAVGTAEAELWRAYYEHRTADLASGIAFNAERSFGLTPYMSARVGYQAARAARIFQPTQSREAAQAALPALTHYFQLLSTAVGADIDPAHAARLELEWWQKRRETDDPKLYEPDVAAATAYLYGAPPARLQRYAELRVAAMDLRDHKGRNITEADWTEIKRLLIEAYTALRDEVQPPVSRASAA